MLFPHHHKLRLLFLALSSPTECENIIFPLHQLNQYNTVSNKALDNGSSLNKSTTMFVDVALFPHDMQCHGGVKDNYLKKSVILSKKTTYLQ